MSVLPTTQDLNFEECLKACDAGGEPFEIVVIYESDSGASAYTLHYRPYSGLEKATILDRADEIIRAQSKIHKDRLASEPMTKFGKLNLKEASLIAHLCTLQAPVEGEQVITQDIAYFIVKRCPGLAEAIEVQLEMHLKTQKGQLMAIAANLEKKGLSVTDLQLNIGSQKYLANTSEGEKSKSSTRKKRVGS